MYKNLIFKILLFISYLFSSIFVYADLQTDIIPDWPSIIKPGDKTWTWVIDSIFKTIVDYTFWLLALITIWVFVYIGYLFITSSWNEEQFKKAWKMLMYAVIGLVVIGLSWGIVKLVTTIGL